MTNRIPKWNGEPCKAQIGTVVIGKSPMPTWWCATREGERIACVRVEYRRDVFFLANEDGRGARKVFEQGGSWEIGHSSIPVDDETTFIPEEA
jgi:hypothetical protein